jgi:hypothetical protein
MTPHKAAASIILHCKLRMDGSKIIIDRCFLASCRLLSSNVRSTFTVTRFHSSVSVTECLRWLGGPEDRGGLEELEAVRLHCPPGACRCKRALSHSRQQLHV